MKTPHFTSLLLASLLGAGLAHADNMNGMDMGNMPVSGQVDTKTNHAAGIVKKVDKAGSRVTIAHGPVASLHWPAMTMTFVVKNKQLYDTLVEGKKVEFDFVQEGGGSTIVSAK